MTTRVTVEGVPNEAIGFAEFSKAIAPILDLLGGVEAKHVIALSITAREVRAKVVTRDKRGHRVAGWAHIARRVDFPEED